MFAWYRELTGLERRTFWACFSGWSMDAMDAQIFSFLIPTLMATWAINSTEAGYLGTASLVAAGLGGWISGALADRFGRVKIMQFTVMWFAFFTFLSGLSQSYGQMLVCRVLQGLGFGGEWGAGAVLMGEIIRPQHRGKAVGCVQSGYGVGWTLATILSTLMFTFVPPEWAWRALLWIGLLPAIFVMYLRRFVEEPPVFCRAKERGSQSKTSFLLIFRPPFIERTLFASLLALGIIGAGSAIVPWLPTFMKTVLQLPVTGVGTYMTLITVGSFFGLIGSAYLCDAIGRRFNFIFFSICAWIITLVYMYVPMGNFVLAALSVPFGFFTLGSYSSLGPFFTELFPTEIRASGQSFSYNFGKLAGAFAVVGVAWLSQYLGLGGAIGLVSLCGYLLAVTAALLLPETRGTELAEITDGQSSSITPLRCTNGRRVRGRPDTLALTATSDVRRRT